MYSRTWTQAPGNRLLRFGSAVAVVVVVAFALTACGRSRQQAAPTPTEIATLAAPTAAPTPEDTATPEPANTPAAATTLTTTVAVTTTANVTQTESMTTTPAITSTEGMTTTSELTKTEAVTQATTPTTTGAVTATAGVTATQSLTVTPELTKTEALTQASTPAATGAVTATAAVTPSVAFLQPTANAVVPVTSTVLLGYAGPEGAGANHLHVLIDTDFVAAGEVIPTDESHITLPEGSTQAEVALKPGSHILRAQVTDAEDIALPGSENRAEIIVGAAENAPKQSVRFVTPTDGATVPPEFSVIMAATGLTVEKSGEVHADAGHFHILVDTDFVPAGEVVPKDANHIHFGGGQLTTTLKLEPGAHVLRLQLADGTHHALEGDQYRATIHVNVKEGAPADGVMFVEPQDGATVTTTFPVKWAAAGLIIEPAGTVIRENGGHLHLLINADFIPAGDVVPKDATHIHFGAGQTSTELTLQPGDYTLRLQMANGAHVAMQGAQYRDEIKITVK